MRNFIIVSLLFVFGACHPNSGQVEQGDVRIISISPGITNTIIDAGYEQFLVGRSPFCFHANQEIPVVGDLRNIDYERLLRLSPTHVFVQKTASGIDAHLLALATQGNFELRAWPLNRVSDIQVIYGDVTEMFGDLRLSFQIDTSENQLVPSPILVITQGIEGNAGLSFGKETYIDDVLQMMGVENVVHQSGWVSLSLEDIGRLQPKAIIVVSDSLINEGSLSSIRSVGYRVIPFVHEHVLVPSSYIVDVAKKLQEVIIEP